MDPKGVLTSKTFWGLFVMSSLEFLEKQGVVPAGTVTDLGQLVGLALALYGRFVATGPLKLI